MTIPDFRHVPRKLFDTGLFDLKTHEGQGAFVDACVSTLHGIDKKFGHLKKKPGQTQVHGHGEDATLYKFSDGSAQAVDFIGGAGGPNPQPGWGVDSSGPIYKRQRLARSHSTRLSAYMRAATGPHFHIPTRTRRGKRFMRVSSRRTQTPDDPFPDPNDHRRLQAFRALWLQRSRDAGATGGGQARGGASRAVACMNRWACAHRAGAHAFSFESPFAPSCASRS